MILEDLIEGLAALFDKSVPEEVSKAAAKHTVESILSAIHDECLGQFKQALEGARHELTILHGLYACDGFHVYGEAQQAGLDPNGAWDMFRESTWQIDISQAIAAIDVALSGTAKEEKPGEGGE